MDDTKQIESIYRRITDEKIKYGTYHKTLFHLHTPASHDYQLLSDWKEEDYKNVSEDKLLELCIKREVVPTGFSLVDVELTGKWEIYSSRVEWLSYLLLANEILRNKYEIVVVTDHNNIQGVEKLRLVIDELKRFKAVMYYPEILYGVEISCADRLHVVGIFDEKQKEKIQKWLEDNLISEKDGTYQTSLAVIEFFKNQISGISYIAHINSSQLFNREKYLSGAYRKKLKDAGCFEYIGIHETAQSEKVLEALKNSKIGTRGFVIDNDAHNIDSISDNYFWIKCGKRSFKTLKEAFDDFDISVSLSVHHEERKYIKGILIEKGGFLKGKSDEDFILRFSDSLNCFIGGRGTGKSTVLQIIDYALGLRVANESLLDFICSHGNIWILYEDCGEEYLVGMFTPNKEKTNDNILRCFGQNEEDVYRYYYRFSEDEIKQYARKHYLEVYSISQNKENGSIQLQAVQKLDTLKNLYDVRYSVNELVQTAGSRQIDDFIRRTMFLNKKLSSPEKMISCRSKNGLAKAIRDMESLYETRKKEVKDVIVPFNTKMKRNLRIVYSQNEPIEDPDIGKWLLGHKASNRDFKGINITEDNAVNYLYYVLRNAGMVAVLRMALKEEDRYKYSISDFLKNANTNLTIDEQHESIDCIFDNLINDNNYSMIISYLRTMVCESEKLSLEFNVNSRTTAQGINYKDVHNLSLGQKVVAMLDFIFGYGDFINDHRPILIDQPEDNLDSQYIYHNLVKQLRDIKDKRQIIIATHNATIVTNAMADQVCVMNSDGKNGWIEKAGYPSEDAIKKDIVNYLEGGVESFKHKMKVYNPILQ